MQDARGAGVGRQKTAGRLFVGVVRAPPILHQHTVRVLTANEDRNGTFDVILSLPPPLREYEHSAPVRRFSTGLMCSDACAPVRRPRVCCNVCCTWATRCNVLQHAATCAARGPFMQEQTATHHRHCGRVTTEL